MTDDTHNLDPNDPHAEPGYEHEHGTAAEAEVWHGEPVDDFGDESAATVSEETSDAGLDQTDVVKKRSALLPGAIVVGGILFLGAVVYLQFGSFFHSSSAGVQPIASKSSPVKTATADVAPKTAMVPVAAPASPNGFAVATPSGTPSTATKGFATYAAAPAAPVPPTPLPSVGMPAPQAIDPAATDMPSVTAAQPLPVAMAAPSSPVVTAASGAPIVTAPPTVMTPPSMAPTPPTVSTTQAPPSSPATDARMTALSARIDDLQKSMAQASQQLSAISDKLSNNQPPSGSTALAIDDRINKIEQKLMQIEHTTPSASDTFPTVTSAPKPVEDSSIKMASSSNPTTSSTPSHKSHHKTVTHHHSVKVASSHHTSKPATSSHPWVLRAATDDQAWVASDTTTTELHPVAVGDEVKGIGRVTSIHEEDSGWVVEGTKGKIQ